MNIQKLLNDLYKGKSFTPHLEIIGCKASFESIDSSQYILSSEQSNIHKNNILEYQNEIDKTLSYECTTVCSITDCSDCDCDD